MTPAFAPKEPSPTAKESRWWMASLLSLAGFSGLGILISFSLPPMESDWIGARALFPMVVGTLLGAIFCVSFAVVSSLKGEKRSGWAWLIALPCLLGLIVSTAGFAGDLSHQAQAQHSNDLRAVTQASIRADPEIVLREQWDKSGNDIQYTAFWKSFSDPEVHYSPQQLERIYAEAPEMREYLFEHPACSSDFLAAHFDEAYARAEKGFTESLRRIVSNPNTPLALVEQAEASTHKNLFGVRAAAKDERLRRIATDPNTPDAEVQQIASPGSNNYRSRTAAQLELKRRDPKLFLSLSK